MNAAAPEGRKFHYDRNFLLQFQAAFKDKISVDWGREVSVGSPTVSRRRASQSTEILSLKAAWNCSPHS
jgi:translation initiation factor 4G